MHTTMVRSWILTAGIGAALAAGCERRASYESRPAPGEHAMREPESRRFQPGAPPRAVGGGPTMSLSTALDELARTRCDREVRCGDVGRGRRYASEQACMATIREQQSRDLNVDECPGGINQKELSECLSEIRNEDCGNPLDTLGRIVACRQRDLCRNVR